MVIENTQEKKKPDKVNRFLKIIITIGFIAIISVIGTIWLLSSDSPTETSVNYPVVVYEVTGSARSVSITLNNATGGTEQYSNIALPAEFKYPSFRDYFLYVSAQNQGSSGWVRVSIYVNGDLYKTSTSQGGYVIASASGTCP